ncbi:chromate efflux transporter [Shimia sagamensis]|uniref:Chromate transporter n=1 Tax=Shimia sagamensis TaxID=1566352 RepID=A0ABY1NI14_9RHOB|nr:chromate efflux transporter [Shimia sagamensis]SMP10062.1 chromate transporter [Shimia sagamensis]
MPTLSELLRVFGRIGLMSFGGPAAQIGLMHQELVNRTGWLKEKEFLGALSFCMLLPGPEAMQLATFCGWKLRGTLGGVLAGALFVLPGAALIFCLVAGYAAFGDLPLVASAFLGVKAAVVAIIVQALLGLSRKVLTTRSNILVSLLSFIALYTGLMPFPAVIVIAGVFGFVCSPSPDESKPDVKRVQSANAWKQTFKSTLIWGTLWLVPVSFAVLAGGFLKDVALFFSQLAVVTFGGAYAVLAYMVQAVVHDFGWLTTDQMMDALGLAETTPGPLILVTQFVATLAGHIQGGASLAITAGLLALWCTFIPCFLWIFAGAPHVSRILANPRLNAALNLISAAVLGVIANLSLWFTINLLFSETSASSFGSLPILHTFDAIAGLLTAAALLAMLRFRAPLLGVLALSAMGSMAIGLL